MIERELLGWVERLIPKDSSYLLLKSSCDKLNDIDYYDIRV